MTFSDEAVEAAADAYEAERERWIVRDATWLPDIKAWQVCRNDDGLPAGEFTETRAFKRIRTSAAMRAALTALEPYLVPEWKDITSAPWYDGARVIVSDGRYVGQGEWLVTEGCWIGCDGICPTVWQPLPAPPATRGEG